jgi:uncharacterized protein YjbI with pentapeptide repeats
MKGPTALVRQVCKTAIIACALEAHHKDARESLSMNASQDTEGNEIKASSDHLLAIIDLEARLIAQEPRPWKVVGFFFNRKKWADTDPRRHEAKMAVFNWIFTSLITLALGGLGGGFLVFLLGAYQAKKMAEQTELMARQTQMMSRQNTLLAKQVDESHEQWIFEYRQTLFNTLYSKEECALKKTPITYINRRTNGEVSVEQTLEDPCLMASSRARAEAAVNLYSQEKSRLKKDCHVGALDDVCRPNFSGVDLSFSELQRKDFSGALFSKATLYRTDLSNGKAVDSKFEYAKLRSFRLIGAIAKRCKFILSPLTKAYFYGGDFEDCHFVDSDASQICFNHASLKNAVFSSVNLDGAKFDHADLTGAVFDNIQNLDADQLRYACSNGGTQLPFDISLRKCPKRKYQPGKIDVDQAVAECSTPN